MGKKSILKDAERALKRTAKSAQSRVDQVNNVAKRVIDGRVSKRRR